MQRFWTISGQGVGSPWEWGWLLQCQRKYKSPVRASRHRAVSVVSHNEQSDAHKTRWLELADIALRNQVNSRYKDTELQKKRKIIWMTNALIGQFSREPVSASQSPYILNRVITLLQPKGRYEGLQKQVTARHEHT